MTKKEKKEFYYIVCIESNYGTTNHKLNQTINYVFFPTFWQCEVMEALDVACFTCPGPGSKIKILSRIFIKARNLCFDFLSTFKISKLSLQ